MIFVFKYDKLYGLLCYNMVKQKTKLNSKISRRPHGSKRR